MHPAPSVIIFTVLSGLGFGLFIWLGFGNPDVAGVSAFWFFALAYLFSVGGLLASVFHLGNAKNAYKSFSQWRTSWLSREGWLAVLALTIFAGFAIGLIFFEHKIALLGVLGAVLSLATIYATSMIYAQLKTIPRWNHWSVSVYFLMFSLAGGAILSGQHVAAILLVLFATAAQMFMWIVGDSQFSRSDSTIQSATGLGLIGKVRLFEGPHTGSNYLLDEMVYVVGRKHAAKLRLLTLVFLTLLPIIILLLVPKGWVSTALAAISFLIGSFISRWLFFAEAEHVVGLYYSKR